MKKLFKALIIILLILILAIIILPFVFKGKIIEQAKLELNSNLNAKVDFDDLSLSLISSFPDFKLEITGLSVVGINEFENDTLADIGSLAVSIDFMTVLKGETYEIKSVNIINPNVYIITLENGKVNWDIAMSSETEDTSEAEVDEESSSFKMSLKKFIISDARLIYNDYESAIHFYVFGMDHSLKGDFTADNTTLKTNTSIDDVTLVSDGLKYLNKANIDFKADFDADLLDSKYTFKNNELRLNNLFLAFNGYLKLLEDNYEMDIDFSASKTEFKNFLSLIPAIYTKDFEDIKTEGKLAFNGFIKGVYTDNSLPAFNFNVAVDDASFKYPDLPESVNNIKIKANASNPGGSSDNTILSVEKLHFEMADNPVDIVLTVKTPVSDPFIDGHIQGELNLAKVKDVYPLESGEELNGEFTANVVLLGNMSSIENEQYNDFKAIGSLLLQNMSYKSIDFPNGIEINNAQLNFSPSHLQLLGFSAQIGKSDLSADGKIENYMAYLFNDELIKGTFTTRSKYFNLNDLMPEDEEAENEVSADDTAALSVIKVPTNINFFLSSTFDDLIYDDIEMKEVAGVVKIKDEEVILKDLKMKLLEGSMIVNGIYTTANDGFPAVDFDLDIKNFDIQQSFKTFVVMDILAPVAKHATGNFSSKLNYFSTLDEEMMPVYSSMSGFGDLSTTQLVLSNVAVLNKLSDALKMGKLKDIAMKDLNLSFEFKDGKVIVAPYNIKYKNISGVVSGTTSFEKEIDYDMKLKIPRTEFGGQANSVLDGLVSQAQSKGVEVELSDVVNVDVKIGGTVSDPTIKTGLKDLTKSATDQVKAQLQKELDAKKKELEDKAQEEIKRIQNEAEKKIQEQKEKAAAEVDRLKKEAEAKAKEEAEKLKKKAEEEFKKKLKDLF